MMSILKKICPFANTITIYTTLHYVTRFLILTFGLLSLIYVITFVETLRRLEENTSFFKILYASFIQIPPVIDKIFPFVIILSTIWSLYTLLKTSELIVIKSSGISLFSMIKSYSLMTFTITLLYVFCIMPILANFHAEYRVQQFQNQSSNSIASANYKSQTQDGDTLIIEIHHQELLKNHFKDIYLTILDKNSLVKKLYYAPNGHHDPAKNLLGFPEIYLFDADQSVLKSEQKIKNYTIKADFLNQKTNITPSLLRDIYDYYAEINHLKQQNLSTKTASILFFNLLIFPFTCCLYVIMAFIFIPTTARGKSMIINILIAIGFALVFYLVDGWFAALAANNSIPLFLALITAKVSVLLLALFYIFDKEYGSSKK